MLYEAEVFARLVEDNEVNHPGLAISRTTAKLQNGDPPTDWRDLPRRRRECGSRRVKLCNEIVQTIDETDGLT